MRRARIRRERRASVRESRPGIQAAEVRRIARCRDPFQVRHQGQQGRVATTTDRAVSLDEAIAIAIRLQQSDQWVAAGEMYRRILEAAPDYPDAVHYSGVLAHQEGRSDEAVALIEAQPRARARSGRLAQQSGDRPAGSARAGRGDRGVPAGDRARPGSCQRAQQPRRPPEGAGQRGRSGSGVSCRHSREPRTLGRLHQPRHPADRPEADARSGRLLLQGHHAQAETSRSPPAARAGALCPRRSGRSRRHLRGVAQGGAGPSHRAAHDRGVLRPRRSGAGVGRVHRT